MSRTPRQQILAALSATDGLTCAELSAATAIAPETVRKQLHYLSRHDPPLVTATRRDKRATLWVKVAGATLEHRGHVLAAPGKFSDEAMADLARAWPEHTGG